MPLSALKRKLTEQFLGHDSQDGRPHGTEHGHRDGQPNGAQHGTQCGFQDGHQHGQNHGQNHGYQDGEAQFYIAGDRLVLCPPGHRPSPNAFEHAVYLLAWLREVFPGPPRVLWVAARDLEHVIYPTFLTVTELPAHSWKAVAGHLRKLTDWRQKDGRRGADRSGSSPIEYMIKGPRKKR